MNTPEIESILRAAPRPAPPAGLPERLGAGVRLRAVPDAVSSRLGRNSWLRRWWPTLVFGGGILACAAALVSQQAELRGLRAQVQAGGTEPGGSPTQGIVAPAATVSTGSGTTAPAPAETRRAEIARLRAEVAELQAAADLIRQLAAENQQLQAQLAAAQAAQPGLTTEDLNAMNEAKARAQSIQCVNNLKNIGLALRIWANDNEADSGEFFPLDFLSLTNELSTPKVLICPADPGRQVAPDWAAFSSANLSYEFLAPGGTPIEPQRVATRCLIHGHVGLCDGSVQMSQGDGSNITRHLVNRDGKLYFE